MSSFFIYNLYLFIQVLAALGPRCFAWAFSRRAGATLAYGEWASHCADFFR